jgi:hypothetical protein
MTLPGTVSMDKTNIAACKQNNWVGVVELIIKKGRASINNMTNPTLVLSILKG